MARKNKSIFYLSKLEVGKVHDYKILKNNFSPSLDWFSNLVTHIDLGYQGFESDYLAKTVLIPFKKRKDEQELCDLKKAYNRKLAQWRVGIEHAIGGMKRYRILAERIRLKSTDQINMILEVCAGFWNLRIRLRETQSFNSL
jgi:hypothetical protein